MSENKRYRVWWNCVSGEVSGVVKSKDESGHYVVRLDNGKCVLVHRKSIRKWAEL